MRPPTSRIPALRVDQRAAANDDGDRQHEHDGRVAEREEEPDAERPPAFLQQEAHGVVDRGDVIGVERVAQAEHVRDEAEPDERRMARRVVQVQPPAGDVQQRDDAVQDGERATTRSR